MGHPRRGSWVITGILLGSVAFLSSTSLAEVRWRDGRSLTAEPTSSAELEAEIERLAGREAKRRVVVHLDGPLDQDRRRALASRGVRLLRPLGGHAWFATLTPGLDPAAAVRVPGLVQVGAITRADKLHPELRLGAAPEWSRLGDDTLVVYVLFHADFDSTRIDELLASHRGSLVSRIDSVHGAVAKLPLDAVEELADDDDVMWVEPPLPKMSGINDLARQISGADALQSPPYELDGSGIGVLVYDGGQVYAHADFGSRLTIGPSDTSPVIDHSTNVAGIIGGDGTESAGQYRGMAPGVDLVSYGFQQETEFLSQGFLYTDPGDIEDDYTEAISTFGVDLANNSVGTNVALNGFPCGWEGDYGTTSAVVDSIARGSLGARLGIFWGIGNERSGSARCGSAYRTTPPPACAKNPIKVGALDSADESVEDFSSWGPCDDGRLQPEIMAPGCETGGDNGITSTGDGGGYNAGCGTSFSAPVATGVAALMLEQYRISFPSAPDPLNSTLKAVLAHTAQEIGNPGPDYQSGYGSVRGIDAVDLIAEGRFLEDEVAQGEVHRFSIVVQSGDPELRVTLAWDDPPAVPNVAGSLVNDLDLRVIDPTGTAHFPWTLDPLNPGDPAVQTQRDDVNILEQVRIDSPVPGSYLVEIEGFDIAEGPAQSFSVATSPGRETCDSAGTILAGAARVECEATLDYRVLDCDENANSGVAESISIQAVSTSEPGGEASSATETGADTGVFSGTLTLSETDGPGVLRVAEGETVTLTYVDADDGQGGTGLSRTVQLLVDCTPPIVTDISVSGVGAGQATVSVTADSPVQVAVRYGTTCGSPDASKQSLNLAVAQEVPLVDLAADTTYRFDVQATDELGRVTIDDNGGGCYEFTTLPETIFLVEMYFDPENPIDLLDTYTVFTPAAVPASYEHCGGQLLGTLFTDPAGGTPLTFTGDDALEVALLDSKTFPFYGQSFGSVWISRNGYVTFGAGDDDMTGSLWDHYVLPRISALFLSRSSLQNGTVSWLQSSEAFVVTWESIRDSANRSNTVQAELFFDGRIRIGWSELETTFAVAGLSDGAGLDDGLVQADLTDTAQCGPRQPRVADLSGQTLRDTPIGFTLVGDDDGTPFPLRFRVDSLPTFGTLSDDTLGATIVSTPHWMLPGSDGVTYTPVIGYAGGDSFDYVADDGGQPPDGGSSDPGLVSITVENSPSLLAEFLVDDADPGWTTTGQWEFGPATVGGGDPASAFSGTNVYGYNIGGQYGFLSGETYLTSTAIDLSTATSVSVEFRRWLRVLSPLGGDHAKFQVSNDGSTWIDVWTNTGAVSDGSWTLVSYDITAWAAGEPTVFLRWVMGPTSVLAHDAGWSLDDIRLVGEAPFDCDSGDPGVIRVPLEVVNLKANGSSPTSVTWSDQALVAGSDTVYELVSGGLDAGLGAPRTCLQATTATSYDDGRTPLAGEGFWYLSRGGNSCGDGPFGTVDRDVALSGVCP